MLRPFALRHSIGPDSSMDLDDVLATKNALNRLGVMPVPSYGLTPYPDHAMLDGVRTFQRQHGLRVDGVMRPDGPTAARLGQELEVQARAASHKDRSSNDALLWPKKNVDSLVAGPPPQRNRGHQVAVAPIAVPFAVWLIPILGAATAAAAMQIYQTLSPVRQQQLRDRYVDEADDDDPLAYCFERYDEEIRRCAKRKHPNWRAGCRQRAAYRRNSCIKNGGRPMPGEIEEWGDADEESGPLNDR